jgi:hypothetical protein
VSDLEPESFEDGNDDAQTSGELRGSKSSAFGQVPDGGADDGLRFVCSALVFEEVLAGCAEAVSGKERVTTDLVVLRDGGEDGLACQLRDC